MRTVPFAWARGETFPQHRRHTPTCGSVVCARGVQTRIRGQQGSTHRSQPPGDRPRRNLGRDENDAELFGAAAAERHSRRFPKRVTAVEEGIRGQVLCGFSLGAFELAKQGPGASVGRAPARAGNKAPREGGPRRRPGSGMRRRGEQNGCERRARADDAQAGPHPSRTRHSPNRGPCLWWTHKFAQTVRPLQQTVRKPFLIRVSSETDYFRNSLEALLLGFLPFDSLCHTGVG
jgi:hypothetical protein